MNQVVISSTQLIDNIKFFKGYKNKDIIMYLKENAYGMGSEFIMSVLYGQGIKHFMFNDIDDTVKAREKYKDIIIYIYDPYLLTLDYVENYNLIVVVHNFQQLEKFKKYPIVINIALSLNGVGFSMEQFKQIDLKKYNIHMIMSHLTWSYNRELFHKNSTDIEEFTKNVHSLGYRTSLCNSVSYLQESICQCNAVRAAHTVYGYPRWIYKNSYPIKSIVEEISFDIIDVKKMKGEKFGYNLSSVCNEEYCGFINMGYINGFRHTLELFYGDNLQDSVTIYPKYSSMSLTWVPLKYPVERVYLVSKQYGKCFDSLDNIKWQLLYDLNKTNRCVFKYL